VFNTDNGLILSTTSDDAWYLQIGVPTNTLTNFNFTLPSIYLSSLTLPAVIPVPTNSFQTYDQIDTIINSWRTGDVRTSLNSFYYFGWLPMNNGCIGYKSTAPSGFSLTRNNQDTWPLYNLIWQSFAAYSTGNSTSSGANLIAQMYTSAGVAVGYGPNVTTPTTAYADWLANKFISLTSMMCQVILGNVPSSALINAYSTTFTATSNVITTTNNVFYFNGMPITFTGTTTLSVNTIYYVSGFNGTTGFSVSTTFANALAGIIVTVASDSGTVSISPAGTYEGEYAHTQLLSELAAHNHTLGNQIQTSGTAINGTGTGYAIINSVTGTTGSSAPFNVTQPGTFYNMYIKL
jgi:hypothetical protein